MATTQIDLTGAAQNVDLPGSQTSDGFGTFLGGLMTAVMAIAAIMVFLFLIWGAIDWITSAGDKSKLESARNKIMNAIVGLIVLAATTGLFIVIQQFLNICILSFAGSC
jgi:hypothetical protein